MKKVLFISLAMVLALSVGLIGCDGGGGEAIPYKNDGWFIEDEQVRLVLKCVDDPNFLTVALRQSTHPSVQIQVESLGQLLLSLVYVVTVA